MGLPHAVDLEGVTSPDLTSQFNGPNRLSIFSQGPIKIAERFLPM